MRVLQKTYSRNLELTERKESMTRQDFLKKIGLLLGGIFLFHLRRWWPRQGTSLKEAKYYKRINTLAG